MLTRRGFMLGSAGLVTGLALTRALDRESSRAANDALALAEPLSVGYWAGDPDATPLNVAAWTGGHRRPRASAEGFVADVVAAHRLPSGDERFAVTGARVAVKGAFEAARSIVHPALAALSVDLLFDPVPGGAAETVPCHAWGLTRRPVANASAAVTLTLPVDRASGLGLTLARANQAPGLASRLFHAAVRGAKSAEPTRWTQSVRWTLGSEAGHPRLRRGVYFVACADRPGREAPDWSRHRFAPCDGDGGPRMLVRPGALGLEPADFDYVVVAVDHAGAEPAPVV